MPDRRRYRLLERIVRHAMTITGLAVLAMTAAGASISFHLERQALRAEVQTAAKLIADRIDEGVADRKTDIRILAHMPPIQAIARAARHGGVDPASGDSTAEWTARLAEIFASFHAMRPEIETLRLIATADNGREVVRVDKIMGQPARIAESRLRQTGGAAWIGAGLELLPDRVGLVPPDPGAGDDAPALLRFIHPIDDLQGRRFGLLVMDVDHERLHQGILAPLALDADVLLAGDAGDSYHWSAATGTGRFRRAGPPDLPAEVLQAVADAAPVFGGIGDAGGRTIATRRMPATAGSGRDATLAMILPPGRVMRQVPLMTLALAGIGGLVLLAGAARTARRLRKDLQPLLEMNASIRSAGPGADLPALPVEREDEIGELARAFRQLCEPLMTENVHARAVLEGAGEGIVSIDDTGRIVQANDAACALFGHDRADLLGRDVGVLMPPEMRGPHATFLERAGSTTGTRPMAAQRTVLARRADGTTFEVEVTINTARGPDGTVIVGIIRDVTERQRELKMRQELIDSLEATVAELERSNAELESFAHVASHDLKAPLRVIANASRWIEEDLGEDLTGETLKAMELLRNRVARMDRLLSDLLDHSRIGRVPEDGTIVSAGRLVADVLALMEVPSGFTIDAAPGLEEIHLPRMPLQKVLLNLLDNAVKHHDRPEGHVRITAEASGDHVTFTVADDGPGIPPELHDRAFAMFQTLRPRDQVEGSGMGLAMIRKTVATIGGDIRLDSDGRGCTFTLDWPLPEIHSMDERRSA